MKLIIDIPEEIVTAIQNGQDYRYDIHTVIAQGKPYDTTGDLISREALKKAIIEHRDDYVEDNFFWSKLFNIIDNAPTVERPQGTWIYQEYDYICSNCSKSALELDDYPYLSSYCPFCGAEMEIPL